MQTAPRFLMHWSNGAMFASSLFLIIGALAGGFLIRRSDEGFPRDVMPRNSAALEWPWRPSDAERIVTTWRRNPPSLHVARRGVLIDTFVFVPFYATAIAMACFWAARGHPGSRWQAVFFCLAWCGWLAGALDWIENAGILAETVGWSFLAPPIAIVCRVKWLLALGAASAALIRGVAATFALVFQK